MAKSRYADATKAARRAAMSTHKASVAANAGNADASAQPSASAATEPARDARRDELTHVDAKGEVRMVDVSDKAETHRIAIAEGTILMHPETQAMVLQDRAKKGDVLACARVAGRWPSSARVTSSPCAIRCSLPRVSATLRPSLRRGCLPRTCPRAGRRRARTGRLAFTCWLRRA